MRTVTTGTPFDWRDNKARINPQLYCIKKKKLQNPPTISILQYELCLIIQICLNWRIYIIIRFNTMLHPTLKWAQRKDKVFIELGLMDILNDKVELTSTHLTFEGESSQKKYGFTLELFEEVDMAQSKWHKTGFHMLFVLEKKNLDAPFWARLIKNKEKNQYIQVDWSKWVDEDEEEEDPSKGLGGFDPNQMQNFGQGGAGSPVDEDDEEEGNLDDLEKEQQLQGAQQQQNENGDKEKTA